MLGIVLDGYGDTSVLQYREDIEKPKITKNDELIVEVHFSGFNHLDTKLRRGYMKQMNVKILGIEYSGVVSEVGADVKDLKVGDRVFGFSLPRMSTYSQFVCVPQNQVLKIPENVSFQEAAIYPCSIYTIWQSYKKLLGENVVNDPKTYEDGKSLEILKGSTVCIVGCSGPIGITALLIAKYIFGCSKVIGICSSKNHEEVKKIGCDVLIDYKTENYVEGIVFKEPELKYVIDCYGGYDNLELFSPHVKNNVNVEYITCGVPDGVSPREFGAKISEKERSYFVGHKHVPTELDFVAGKLFGQFSCFGKTPILEFGIKDAAKCHDAYHTRRPMGKMVLKVK